MKAIVIQRVTWRATARNLFLLNNPEIAKILSISKQTGLFSSLDDAVCHRTRLEQVIISKDEDERRIDVSDGTGIDRSNFIVIFN